MQPPQALLPEIGRVSEDGACARCARRRRRKEGKDVLAERRDILRYAKGKGKVASWGSG